MKTEEAPLTDGHDKNSVFRPGFREWAVNLSRPAMESGEAG
jgi:hypothetical protein